MRGSWSHLRREGHEKGMNPASVQTNTDRTEFGVVFSCTDDLAFKVAWSEDVKMLCKALDYLTPKTGSGKKKSERGGGSQLVRSHPADNTLHIDYPGADTKSLTYALKPWWRNSRSTKGLMIRLGPRTLRIAAVSAPPPHPVAPSASSLNSCFVFSFSTAFSSASAANRWDDMPGYEERASIRQDAEAIFNMVCDLETPEQWAEWLRVPLALAARTGNADLVDKLLKAGANAGAGVKGCNAETLLHAAAEGGNEEVLSAFLGTKARKDIDTKARATRRTPLNVAVRCGHVGAADALMLAGADANIVDAGKECPLHLAIKGGHAGLAKNLLIRGADPEVQVSSGDTPLHVAAKVDNVDILAALVGAGADIEARNRNGHRPLHSSAFNNTCAAMRALLQLGAEVDAGTPYFGYTPLNIACSRGNLDAADLLLRWGADETARDKMRKTPSDDIPDIAKAAEEDRPRLERLSRLLASAPRDRAWRRRGMLVLCRAHPDRLRLVVEIPDTTEAIEQPQQGRPSQRSRRGHMNVEVTMGGVPNRAAGETAGSRAWGGGRRRGGREGLGGGGGGFGGVAAWLVVLEEEDVFRNIVGFL